MLISILLLLAVTIGSVGLTYLLFDDETMMFRLAAGNIIGCAIFGTALFALTFLFGLTYVSVAVALLITISPLILLADKDRRKRFDSDKAKAFGKLQGGTLARFTGFAYYAFFFIIFCLFFSQTMYVTPAGIFTGGSNNLGDLPYHLGAIFSFTDAGNFPPQNPSYAGAKFTYPFIADLTTAATMRLGSSVESTFFVQNVAWAMSLLVILERFTVWLTRNKLAGRIAPILLFSNGGLGFVWSVKDYWEQGLSLWQFLWNLPRDYTIGDHFRWGNSMVVLFITQRSLLLGMPLTLLVLGWLWKRFTTQNPVIVEIEDRSLIHASSFSPFVFGLLAGTLPLIHLHSLIVLFVVTACLFAIQPNKWKQWMAFGVGVCLIAIPELAWSMTGSATRTSEFIGWHFGWDRGQTNVVWFWVKNTGILIPILIAAIYYIFQSNSNDGENAHVPRRSFLILFYIPFALLFLVSNVVKLAPWEWDNIKVLIYWFVGSLPLIALLLAKIWERGWAYQPAAIGLIFVLTAAGALDVLRTMTSVNKIKVFDTDAVRLAEQLKAKTEPNAVFLNAPTYNSAIVLSGRLSFMRYVGHLSSHGINYLPREDEVKKMYQGGPVAEMLMKKNDISYVLISPEEKSSMTPNEDAFKKFPVVAESGLYRVYKVKE
ncbi:MAG: hypothetical protein JNL64_06790 [Blastocatellia bacterium]|nr:hypothetical protein [Blastocatellia bacterium]